MSSEEFRSFLWEIAGLESLAFEDSHKPSSEHRWSGRTMDRNEAWSLKRGHRREKALHKGWPFEEAIVVAIEEEAGKGFGKAQAGTAFGLFAGEGLGNRNFENNKAEGPRTVEAFAFAGP